MTTSNDLRDEVYNFKTKNKEGFVQSEIDALIKEHIGINMKRFNDAMMGNTCLMRDGELVIYHCDVLTALRCGLENRDMHPYEFD
jgi:hypothetical protein